MKKLQLAVVGPGLIGKKHIKLIDDSDEADLCSIIAPDRAHNHDVASIYNVPLYYALEDCLAEQKLDGVIISSPNQFHYEQAAVCIRAGIPVLIEKPVTADLAQGESLVQLAKLHNAKALVGHHRTYSPILKAARTVINSGRLGRLVSVIGSAQFYKPDQYFKDGPWRAEPGGGPILINLIHEVGNLRTLVGEIMSVQAVASSNIRTFPVEDTVAMNFIFRNGALGTFLLSDTAATPKSWEQTSRENPSYPNYTDEDCYTIAGTKGSISIPTMRIKYYPEGTQPSWWNAFEEEVLSIPRVDPLQCQLEHFINVIKGKEMPLVSVEDGFRNLLITEAIKKSIQTKTVVEIPE
jgi:predicted dehydrogenase